MPTYRVISKGFYDGKLYEPDGVRNVIVTDKPIKPLPKWLEEETVVATKKPRRVNKSKPKVEVENTDAVVETL